MRYFLVLAALAVPCAAQAGDNDDCSASSASTGLNNCFLHAYQDAQQTEDAAFKALLAATKGKKRRQRLDSDEIAWSQARDGDCEAIRHPELTYSDVTMDYYWCLQKWTEERTEYLKHRLNCTNGDKAECGIPGKAKGP